MWKWLISNIYVSCTSKLAADINHIFLSATITATPAFGLWFWHQSDAWCQKVFGMAIAFWHSLPRVLQEHVKHEHISPFLQYNLNKELHYSPGILRRSLGLICPRLHPWVTSQLPGLLHLPVKPQLSTSCSITNMIWTVTGNDPLYRLAYREEVFC